MMRKLLCFLGLHFWESEIWSPSSYTHKCRYCPATKGYKTWG